MLKTINGGSRYIMVNGGMPSPTYTNNSSGLGAGNIRWNSSTQAMEVYDGYTWMQINTSHASVGLTPDAENAISWAIKKEHEEVELERLAKTNPTIADLLNQKKDLDQKIKMVQILTKEESKIGTN